MTQFSRDEQISWWKSSLVNYFSWWALVVAAIIIGLGSWLMVYPVYEQWNTMTKAEQLSEELSIYQSQYDNLISKSNDWKKLNRSVGKDLYLILPQDIDLPNLMTEIDAVVKSSIFTLNGIAFNDGSREQVRTGSKEESRAGIKVVRIVINVSGGNYTAFKELVKKIESAWRLLEVRDVSFVTDDAYTIELASYYYP